MASATPLHQCIKCQIVRGSVLCGGCQRWFCLNDLVEHRTELGQVMTGLTHEHDQLEHSLTLNDNDDHSQRSLISQIDQWELKSIERIKDVANKARRQLKNSVTRSKRNIGKLLCPITNEMQESRQVENYTEIDLARWTNQLKELREKLYNPPSVEIKHQDDQASSTQIPLIQLLFHDHDIVPRHISKKNRWSLNGQTVAGGHEQNDAVNQLNCPFGLDVDDDRTIFIADMKNHRIIRWKPKPMATEIIIAGGKGNRTDQLDHPLAVLIDRTNDDLIVSEYGNRRVMRWSLKNHKNNVLEREVIIANIHSLGLAIDDEGSLYISDFENNEVRRYSPADRREGVIVAGGHGQGIALNQLHGPRNIFIDDDQSIYVSDTWNHRVIKWMKNAREGVVVAGGHGRGSSLEHLSYPSGLFVDQEGSVYVADQWNHRVMRWLKNAQRGEMIVGRNDPGTENDRLNGPTSISFDNQGNLYVADRDNCRIQRFDLQ